MDTYRSISHKICAGTNAPTQASNFGGGDRPKALAPTPGRRLSNQTTNKQYTALSQKMLGGMGEVVIV